MVADIIIAHLRTPLKIFSWYKNIGFPESTSLMRLKIGSFTCTIKVNNFQNRLLKNAHSTSSRFGTIPTCFPYMKILLTMLGFYDDLL